jgi:DNA-binding transcriptional regulator YiaG
MNEGLRIAKGEKLTHVRIAEFIVREPKNFSAEQIRKLRRQIGLSQPVFAGLLGVSVNAIRNWEQGRNAPGMMARRFLEMIADDPQAFLEQAESMEIYEQRASNF